MGIPAVNPSALPPGAVALPPTPALKPAVPPSSGEGSSRLGGAWAPPPPPPPPAPSAARMSDASPLAAAVAERAVSEVSARSAEHEALSKLSREVIERIVWEVVPELAETIIREQLDRLVAERQK
jgi:hypothetical protein